MKKRVYIFLTAALLFVSVGCTERQKVVVPTTTQYTYRVEYTFSMLSNDSVGNEWQTSVTYNGKTIQNGEIISVPTDTDIVLCGEVIEIDDVPDEGTATLHFKRGSHTSNTTDITVTENRGMYIGNTATWRLSCSITRVEDVL